MSAALSIVSVRARADREAFIALPRRLYAGAPGFTAPLAMERRDNLDPRKNPFFDHAEAAYWLARRGGRVVGRISAQIDRLAQTARGAGGDVDGIVGFFGFLDAENDAETFAALLRTAEQWATARDAVVLRGPFSHSINEESGLRVSGFDARPVMMMPYHPPYAEGHVTAAGYAGVKDLIAYDYQVGRTTLRDTNARLKNDRRFTVRTMDSKRYEAEIAALVAVFNDAWSQNWGFVPFTEAEIAHMARELKPLIIPDLVFFVEVEGAPVAMAVCLPNLDEAIRDLDGALAPFGWARLLWRLKVSGVKSCRIPLMGIAQRHQSSVVGAMLVRAMLEALDLGMRARGFERAEMSWILEDNMPMRRVLEGIGAEPYKIYRVFERRLA